MFKKVIINARRERKKKEKIIESHFCLCTVSNTYTHTQRWNLFFRFALKGVTCIWNIWRTDGLFLPENINSLSYRSREKEIRVRERRTITKPKNKFWSKENVFFFYYVHKKRKSGVFFCVYIYKSCDHIYIKRNSGQKKKERMRKRRGGGGEEQMNKI